MAPLQSLCEISVSLRALTDDCDGMIEKIHRKNCLESSIVEVDAPYHTAADIQISFLKDLDYDTAVEGENDDVLEAPKEPTKEGGGGVGKKMADCFVFGRWVEGIHEQCWLAVQLACPHFHCALAHSYFRSHL